MIKIYGIRNCDTMQKAMKWLDTKKLAYTFHDYKESGIDKVTIETWLQHLPLDKVINTKSTTYRGLTEEEKSAIHNKPKAIALMIKHTSIIKRPLWDLGDGKFVPGWNEHEIASMLL